MKIAEQTKRQETNSQLDLLTIRRRVAKIKNNWTPEVAHARALEGKRRRRELDALVEGLLKEMSQDFLGEAADLSEQSHGLTLVG